MKNCYLIDFYKNLNEQINYIFDNINLFNEIRINGQHAKKFLNEDKTYQNCEIMEKYKNKLLSLPMYPELEYNKVHYICKIINKF